MEKLLHNKAAIITGAANGVGQIISQKFAEEGADLILADMDEENLKGGRTFAERWQQCRDFLW